ncbi:MAG: nitronate monooxygenase, partial [bacterium]|nr:nitronate monooxygenase [bacterium]
HCIRTCDVKNSPYCIAIALTKAMEGELENGFAFAGKNAYRTDKIISVQELFDTLIKEYQES